MMKKFSLIKSTLNHDLCTIKAIKHIQMADIIIADEHTDPKLFHYASEKCTIIPYKPEKTILSFPHIARVVRLTEEISSTHQSELDEMELFRNLGYDAELIPGISMVNGITGENYFPLTIRGRNESFWVYDSRMICTNKKEKYRQLAYVAESNATLIILTDLSLNLEEQIKSLITTVSLYRCLETPVLCCQVTSEVTHTTIKDLMHHASKNERTYMLVINPSIATTKRTLSNITSIPQTQMAI